MTLSLASVTSSGIVLTADSRQTYVNNARMTKIGTDNAVKVFQLSKNVGMVISGRAFFKDSKDVLKDTGWFVDQFRKTIPKNNSWSVRQIAEKLNEYFVKIYVEPEAQRIQDDLNTQIIAQGGTNPKFDRDKLTIKYTFTDKDGKVINNSFIIDAIHCIVAGYDNDEVGKAYLTMVPDGPSIERNTESGGPLWIGQTDIVGRVIKGHGWEINQLGFVSSAKAAGQNIDAELAKLEYIINWGTMTLQDAIDLCILLTRMTESIQRFSDGTVMYPGGITGVGGHINVATITPLGGFKWIDKKELKAEEPKQ